MNYPDLNVAKERLYQQTKGGIFTNFPLRYGQFQSLKKLKYSAIMRAADEPTANGLNLPYLSNQTFHKDVVNIVHNEAVFDANRQRRETRQFFEENIIVEGQNLLAAERVSENLIKALSEENIHKYMVNVTGYGTENIKFRDLVEKERAEQAGRSQRSAQLRDEALVSLIDLNKELLADLRAQRLEPKAAARNKEPDIENAEYTIAPNLPQRDLKILTPFEQRLIRSRQMERERFRA